MVRHIITLSQASPTFLSKKGEQIPIFTMYIFESFPPTSEKKSLELKSLDLPSHNYGVQNQGAGPDMALFLTPSLFVNVDSCTKPLEQCAT